VGKSDGCSTHESVSVILIHWRARGRSRESNPMKHRIGRIVVLGGFVAGGGMAWGCASSKGDAGPGPSIPTEALCEAQFDALETVCPVGNKDVHVADCQQQQRHYAGIGCQDEFDAWLQCTTTPGYHCADDTGCEVSQNGYFACQSQAVQRTGCVRLGAQDTERCSDAAKPFAFSCLAAAPPQCVQVVTAGAGIWCCPQL
jgi:hypothetical protein